MRTRALSLFAVVLAACSSFGETEPPAGGPATTDAATQDAAPPGDAGGFDAGAIACPPGKVRTFGLSELIYEKGATTLTDGVLVADVASTGAGSTGQAYRAFELGGASSLVLAFDMELAGVDGVHAEPGCTVDLHEHPTNDTPVTYLYFVHETSRSYHFAIESSGADVFTASLAGLLATSTVKHSVRLALDSIDPPRLAGSLTFDGARHDFDVALPNPVVRIGVTCGLYFVKFSGMQSFKTTTSAFAGTACMR